MDRNEILPESAVGKAHDVLLKSGYDDLELLATAWKFKKAVTICTLRCIAAAADGYQYTLNGNIIANQGFINAIGFPDAAGTYTLNLILLITEHITESSQQNSQYTALWGAMQSLGQLLGMVFLNPVSDRIGRRYTLYVLWLILVGSIIIESLATDWKQWAGAKLLACMGVGCIHATLPIYISEWAPVNIRGAMISAYGVWNNLGIFLAPLILYIVQTHDPKEWGIPIYTRWAFLGIMLPIFIWLPETPSYFAAKDMDDEGRASLRRVNGGIRGYDVDVEYAIIKNIILEERAMRAELGHDIQGFREILQSYINCFKGPNAKRTLGSTLPACAQQLTGLSFLSTYASLSFKQSGFTNAFFITTIITSIKVFAIAILIFTTDRIGRRPYVLSMAILCTLMMLLVGILGQLPSTGALKNVLIVAACFWSYGSAVIGALGWTFQLRARTAGLVAAMSVCFGLTFNTALPVMLDVNGANWEYKTAWLFFATGVVIIVLAWLFLPETAQRNSAELDEMYEKRIPAWHTNKYETDVQALHQRHGVSL